MVNPFGRKNPEKDEDKDFQGKSSEGSNPVWSDDFSYQDEVDEDASTNVHDPGVEEDFTTEDSDTPKNTDDDFDGGLPESQEDEGFLSNDEIDSFFDSDDTGTELESYDPSSIGEGSSLSSPRWVPNSDELPDDEIGGEDTVASAHRDENADVFEADDRFLTYNPSRINNDAVDGDIWGDEEEEEEKKKGGWFPWVLGGLVAAGLAFAGWGLWGHNNANEASVGDDRAVVSGEATDNAFGEANPSTSASTSKTSDNSTPSAPELDEQDNESRSRESSNDESVKSMESEISKLSKDKSDLERDLRKAGKTRTTTKTEHDTSTVTKQKTKTQTKTRTDTKLTTQNRTITNTKTNTRTVTPQPRTEVRTSTVTRNVPGPERVTTRTVTRNVPGPERVVTETRTVDRGIITKTTTVIERVR